mgnify:CR=1 FL=1
MGGTAGSKHWPNLGFPHFRDQRSDAHVRKLRVFHIFPICRSDLRVPIKNFKKYRFVKKPSHKETLSNGVVESPANAIKNTFPDRVLVSVETQKNISNALCWSTWGLLEGTVAFEELAKRLHRPAFAPGNTFEYEPSFIMRGLTQLDLLVEKRTPTT